jgi:hypothetical protein
MVEFTKRLNLKIAKAIETFGKKYELLTDTRIYFNGIAWDYDSSGNKKVIKRIKASKYFHYANDKSVSVSSEGGLYEVMNASGSMYFGMQDELYKILNKLGVYYELGNAWNFAVYSN